MVGIATLTFVFNVRVQKHPPIVIQRAWIYPLVGPKGLNEVNFRGLGIGMRSIIRLQHALSMCSTKGGRFLAPACARGNPYKT